MKKLLKVTLPPFIGFFIFFIVIRYSSLYFTLRIDQMGDGTLLSFMSFYRYTLPLLFAVAFLTQLLIVVPIWRSVTSKTAAHIVNAFADLIFVCLIFSAGISYAIWDSASGVPHLLKLIEFMTAVQLVYWIINFVILFILE